MKKKESNKYYKLFYKFDDSDKLQKNIDKN